MDETIDNISQNRPARKSPLRRIAKTAVLLLVIWAVFLGVIRITLSPSVLNRLIDKYAAEYVDGSINTGKVSLSVFRHFPNLGLTIDDFSITYPSQRYGSIEDNGVTDPLTEEGLGTEADTLACFRKFSIRLNVFALVGGQLSIPHAELAGPRIFAHRYRDGQANWDIIRIPEDTTAEESSLPDLKFGRISLTERPHIVYTDRKDTLFAVADLKGIRLNGRLDVQKTSRNRIGIRLDSLDLHAHTASDTLACLIDRIGIKENGKIMQIMAKADASLASRSFGRMNIPMKATADLEFPADDVPAITISGLKADIASVPIQGNADIRLRSDRASVKAELIVEDCKANDLLDDYIVNFIPEASEIKTDASINLIVDCDGDYIYKDGSLPGFDVRINIPESEIKHIKTGTLAKAGLDVSVRNSAEGMISASLDKASLSCDGLRLDLSGTVPDIMEEDIMVRIDADLEADLERIGMSVPENVGLVSSGKVHASVKGSFRRSHLDIYRFSQSSLEGHLCGDSVIFRIPKDSINIDIDNFDFELKPETMVSKADSSLSFKLMGIHGTIGKAALSYGTMGLSGERVSISAKNSSDNDTTKVGRLGGRMNAANIVMTDASGLEVQLKGTENGFQMLPKKGRPEVPMLTLNSANDRIMLKDGTNRIILTDADFGAMAAMNTVERRQMGRIFMDSLARMYPDVPRDSLLIHARAHRQMREIPEWMKEEDFRKQDLDIKLDETLAKYFREWDLNGSINVRTGILMTPYLPIRNILRGFEVTFDNNRIGIDSIKVRSGESEIAAKGELTGLRRALLGRGGLVLDIDIMSDKVNATELLAAYSTGSRYVPPKDKEAVSEATDAEFFKMVTNDSLSVNDSLTPLIVVPSNLNADIRLNASNISYSDLNISKMHSKLTMKERCVQITETEAASNMGDISFEGFYATRSKQNIKAGFSFNFKDITAEKVIDMMPAVDTIMPLLKSFNGQLDCELAATAAIDTNMNIIPPSINGIIRITGKNLSIKESDMFRDLAKKLMFKNKNEGNINEMSVEGVISDSMLEVFPFVLKLDRYTLAMSGIHNMDESFRYHVSLLKSPFVIRLGIDLYGDNFNDIRFKIGKAKYKSTNVPVFSAVIDTTKINLVNSIRGIFEKGVDAAVSDNERREAIEKHKEEIGYIRAVDQELEALTRKEEEQMKADEEALKEQENAQEMLAKAVQQMSTGQKTEEKKETKTNNTDEQSGIH